MDKSKLNYVVDALMTVSFIVTAITSLIIFFFLPSGVRQGRYQELLGVTKFVWTGIHNWAGILFIVLVIVHFVLHWNWVVCMTKKFFKKKDKECKKA